MKTRKSSKHLIEGQNKQRTYKPGSYAARLDAVCKKHPASRIAQLRRYIWSERARREIRAAYEEKYAQSLPEMAPMHTVMQNCRRILQEA